MALVLAFSAGMLAPARGFLQWLLGRHYPIADVGAAGLLEHLSSPFQLPPGLVHAPAGELGAGIGLCLALTAVFARQVQRRKEVQTRAQIALRFAWVPVALAAVLGLGAAIVAGDWPLAPASAAHAFAADVAVLSAWALLAATLRWSGRFRNELFHQAKSAHRALWWPEHLPGFAAVATGLGAVAVAHGRFGRNPLTVVAADAVFVLFMLVGLGGVTALAFSAASARPRGTRLLLRVVGVAHALLQTALPLALIAFARLPVIVGLAGALALAGVIGVRLGARGRGGRLALLWLAVGLGALVLVHLGPVARPLSLLALLAAGALGAALACTNFGWYLAIASLLGAHNNEAGGAARLETHRLLLRIPPAPGRPHRLRHRD